MGGNPGVGLRGGSSSDSAKLKREGSVGAPFYKAFFIPFLVECPLRSPWPTAHGMQIPWGVLFESGEGGPIEQVD